jgi:multimeric flavodoxin WrbA
MLVSDGVIFVSPAYCQNVTALMKNFVDRFAYIFHRPRFFNQKALIISTTCGAGLKETLNYLEGRRRGGCP